MTKLELVLDLDEIKAALKLYVQKLGHEVDENSLSLRWAVVENDPLPLDNEFEGMEACFVVKQAAPKKGKKTL